MPGKEPKHPNNDAEALENWEDDGGPASDAADDSPTKKKRPRDLNRWAKRMVDVATGEVVDREIE